MLDSKVPICSVRQPKAFELYNLENNGSDRGQAYQRAADLANTAGLKGGGLNKAASSLGRPARQRAAGSPKGGPLANPFLLNDRSVSLR